MDASELFTEFLFGSGAWLGLLFVVAVMLVIVKLNKAGIIVAFGAGTLMSILYWTNDPPLMWQGILMLLCMIVAMIFGIHSGD